jgi:exonuclease III
MNRRLSTRNQSLESEFPVEAIRQAGYQAIWRGEKPWNGVAIFAKQAPDVIALRGDWRARLKRAAQLVRRYGSLNAVLEAGFCRTEAKMLRLYRLIAMMDASVPLPSLVD